MSRNLHPANVRRSVTPLVVADGAAAETSPPRLSAPVAHPRRGDGMPTSATPSNSPCSGTRMDSLLSPAASRGRPAASLTPTAFHSGVSVPALTVTPARRRPASTTELPPARRGSVAPAGDSPMALAGAGEKKRVVRWRASISQSPPLCATQPGTTPAASGGKGRIAQLLAARATTGSSGTEVGSISRPLVGGGSSTAVAPLSDAFVPAASSSSDGGSDVEFHDDRNSAVDASQQRRAAAGTSVAAAVSRLRPFTEASPFAALTVADLERADVFLDAMLGVGVGVRGGARTPDASPYVASGTTGGGAVVALPPAGGGVPQVAGARPGQQKSASVAAEEAAIAAATRQAGRMVDSALERLLDYYGADQEHTRAVDAERRRKTGIAITTGSSSQQHLPSPSRGGHHLQAQRPRALSPQDLLSASGGSTGGTTTPATRPASRMAALLRKTVLSSMTPAASASNSGAATPGHGAGLGTVSQLQMVSPTTAAPDTVLLADEEAERIELVLDERQRFYAAAATAVGQQDSAGGSLDRTPDHAGGRRRASSAPAGASAQSSSVSLRADDPRRALRTKFVFPLNEVTLRAPFYIGRGARCLFPHTAAVLDSLLGPLREKSGNTNGGETDGPNASLAADASPPKPVGWSRGVGRAGHSGAQPLHAPKWVPDSDLPTTHPLFPAVRRTLLMQQQLGLAPDANADAAITHHQAHAARPSSLLTFAQTRHLHPFAMDPSALTHFANVLRGINGPNSSSVFGNAGGGDGASGPTSPTGANAGGGASFFSPLLPPSTKKGGGTPWGTGGGSPSSSDAENDDAFHGEEDPFSILDSAAGYGAHSKRPSQPVHAPDDAADAAGGGSAVNRGGDSEVTPSRTERVVRGRDLPNGREVAQMPAVLAETVRLIALQALTRLLGPRVRLLVRRMRLAAFVRIYPASLLPPLVSGAAAIAAGGSVGSGGTGSVPLGLQVAATIADLLRRGCKAPFFQPLAPQQQGRTLEAAQSITSWKGLQRQLSTAESANGSVAATAAAPNHAEGPGFFDDFSFDLLTTIAASADVVSVPAGTVLVYQGEPMASDRTQSAEMTGLAPPAAAWMGVAPPPAAPGTPGSNSPCIFLVQSGTCLAFATDVHRAALPVANHDISDVAPLHPGGGRTRFVGLPDAPQPPVAISDSNDPLAMSRVSIGGESAVSVGALSTFTSLTTGGAAGAGAIGSDPLRSGKGPRLEASDVSALAMAAPRAATTSVMVGARRDTIVWRQSYTTGAAIGPFGLGSLAGVYPVTIRAVTRAEVIVIPLVAVQKAARAFMTAHTSLPAVAASSGSGPSSNSALPHHGAAKVFTTINGKNSTGATGGPNAGGNNDNGGTVALIAAPGARRLREAVGSRWLAQAPFAHATAWAADRLRAYRPLINAPIHVREAIAGTVRFCSLTEGALPLPIACAAAFLPKTPDGPGSRPTGVAALVAAQAAVSQRIAPRVAVLVLRGELVLERGNSPALALAALAGAPTSARPSTSSGESAAATAIAAGALPSIMVPPEPGTWSFESKPEARKRRRRQNFRRALHGAMSGTNTPSGNAPTSPSTRRPDDLALRALQPGGVTLPAGSVVGLVELLQRATGVAAGVIAVATNHADDHPPQHGGGANGGAGGMRGGPEMGGAFEESEVILNQLVRIAAAPGSGGCELAIMFCDDVERTLKNVAQTRPPETGCAPPPLQSVEAQRARQRLETRLNAHLGKPPSQQPSAAASASGDAGRPSSSAGGGAKATHKPGPTFRLMHRLAAAWASEYRRALVSTTNAGSQPARPPTDTARRRSLRRDPTCIENVMACAARIPLLGPLLAAGASHQPLPEGGAPTASSPSAVGGAAPLTRAGSFRPLSRAGSLNFGGAGFNDSVHAPLTTPALGRPDLLRVFASLFTITHYESRAMIFSGSDPAADRVILLLQGEVTLQPSAQEANAQHAPILATHAYRSVDADRGDSDDDAASSDSSSDAAENVNLHPGQPASKRRVKRLQAAIADQYDRKKATRPEVLRWRLQRCAGYTCVVPHRWAAAAVCVGDVTTAELPRAIYVAFLRDMAMYNVMRQLALTLTVAPLLVPDVDRAITWSDVLACADKRLRTLSSHDSGVAGTSREDSQIAAALMASCSNAGSSATASALAAAAVAAAVGHPIVYPRLFTSMRPQVAQALSALGVRGAEMQRRTIAERIEEERRALAAHTRHERDGEVRRITQFKHHDVPRATWPSAKRTGDATAPPVPVHVGTTSSPLPRLQYRHNGGTGRASRSGVDPTVVADEGGSMMVDSNEAHEEPSILRPSVGTWASSGVFAHSAAMGASSGAGARSGDPKFALRTVRDAAESMLGAAPPATLPIAQLLTTVGILVPEFTVAPAVTASDAAALTPLSSTSTAANTRATAMSRNAGGGNDAEIRAAARRLMDAELAQAQDGSRGHLAKRATQAEPSIVKTHVAVTKFVFVRKSGRIF